MMKSPRQQQHNDDEEKEEEEDENSVSSSTFSSSSSSSSTSSFDYSQSYGGDGGSSSDGATMLRGCAYNDKNNAKNNNDNGINEKDNDWNDNNDDDDSECDESHTNMTRDEALNGLPLIPFAMMIHAEEEDRNKEEESRNKRDYRDVKGVVVDDDDDEDGDSGNVIGRGGKTMKQEDLTTPVNDDALRSSQNNQQTTVTNDDDDEDAFRVVRTRTETKDTRSQFFTVPWPTAKHHLKSPGTNNGNDNSSHTTNNNDNDNANNTNTNNKNNKGSKRILVKLKPRKNSRSRIVNSEKDNEEGMEHVTAKLSPPSPAGKYEVPNAKTGDTLTETAERNYNRACRQERRTKEEEEEEKKHDEFDGMPQLSQLEPHQHDDDLERRREQVVRNAVAAAYLSDVSPTAVTNIATTVEEEEEEEETSKRNRNRSFSPVRWRRKTVGMMETSGSPSKAPKQKSSGKLFMSTRRHSSCSPNRFIQGEGVSQPKIPTRTTTTTTTTTTGKTRSSFFRRCSSASPTTVPSDSAAAPTAVDATAFRRSPVSGTTHGESGAAISYFPSPDHDNDDDDKNDDDDNQAIEQLQRTLENCDEARPDKTVSSSSPPSSKQRRSSSLSRHHRKSIKGARRKSDKDGDEHQKEEEQQQQQQQQNPATESREENVDQSRDSCCEDETKRRHRSSFRKRNSSSSPTAMTHKFTPRTSKASFGVRASDSDLCQSSSQDEEKFMGQHRTAGAGGEEVNSRSTVKSPRSPFSSKSRRTRSIHGNASSEDDAENAEQSPKEEKSPLKASKKQSYPGESPKDRHRSSSSSKRLGRRSSAMELSSLSDNKGGERSCHHKNSPRLRRSFSLGKKTQGHLLADTSPSKPGDKSLGSQGRRGGESQQHHQDLAESRQLLAAARRRLLHSASVSPVPASNQNSTILLYPAEGIPTPTLNLHRACSEPSPTSSKTNNDTAVKNAETEVAKEDAVAAAEVVGRMTENTAAGAASEIDNYLAGLRLLHATEKSVLDSVDYSNEQKLKQLTDLHTLRSHIIIRIAMLDDDEESKNDDGNVDSNDFVCGVRGGVAPNCEKNDSPGRKDERSSLQEQRRERHKQQLHLNKVEKEGPTPQYAADDEGGEAKNETYAPQTLRFPSLLSCDATVTSMDTLSQTGGSGVEGGHGSSGVIDGESGEKQFKLALVASKKAAVLPVETQPHEVEDENDAFLKKSSNEGVGKGECKGCTKKGQKEQNEGSGKKTFSFLQHKHSKGKKETVFQPISENSEMKQKTSHIQTTDTTSSIETSDAVVMQDGLHSFLNETSGKATVPISASCRSSSSRLRRPSMACPNTNLLDNFHGPGQHQPQHQEQQLEPQQAQQVQLNSLSHKTMSNKNMTLESRLMPLPNLYPKEKPSSRFSPFRSRSFHGGQEMNQQQDGQLHFFTLHESTRSFSDYSTASSIEESAMVIADNEEEECDDEGPKVAKLTTGNSTHSKMMLPRKIRSFLGHVPSSSTAAVDAPGDDCSNKQERSSNSGIRGITSLESPTERSTIPKHQLQQTSRKANTKGVVRRTTDV